MTQRPSHADLVDPAVILAIRDGVSQGMQPVLGRLDTIDRHISEQAVETGRLKQQLEDHINSPTTDRTSKKGSIGDRLWQAIAFGAATTIGTGAATGVLYLLQHKGAP